MIIYILGGIGADKRIVEKLNLKHEIRYIEYLVPDKNETISLLIE